MSGGSTKREMKTATSHGKAPSRESGAKGREESPPRVKSHRSGDKKKRMKKVVYYETDSSSPSTSGSDAASVTSKRMSARSLVRSSYAIPPFLNAPLYFPSH
jgi:SRSO17 transposase